MSDGSLTQDEIDRLLQGADDSGSDRGGSVGLAAGGGFLTPEEFRTSAILILDALKSSAQGLSLILSKAISLDGAPKIEIRSPGDIELDYTEEFILLVQSCRGAVEGNFGIFFPKKLAKSISDQMIGSDAPVEDLASNSARQSTLKESIGPLLFSVVSQFSKSIGSPVTPQPIDIYIPGASIFPLSEADEYVCVEFPFSLENEKKSRIILAFPMPMASIFQSAVSPMGSDFGDDSDASFSGGAAASANMGNMNIPASQDQKYSSAAVPAVAGSLTSPDANLELLMDVQMQLTVELGRTKMYIKEILGLGEGSIIELDKLAGEPVDLLVNAKLIAKGEVVVIDENFGVRVTDIVEATERLGGGSKRV